LEEPHTARSTTRELSLEEVVRRLAGHATVDGVLLIGSTGKDTLTPASDYDMIVVLAQMPAPLHVGVTLIDGRLSDLIFVTTQEIDTLLHAEDEVAHDTWQGRLLHWFASGEIVVDRKGRLAQAKSKAQQVRTADLAGAGDRYRLWFGINYNVKQTQRMLLAEDSVYDTAVDLRLLYCLSELWSGYFQLRGLPWRGEKAAVRLLAEYDPAYLEKFRQCLAEPDRQCKVERYTELAALTLAPLGGLWDGDSTAIQFHAQDWQPGQDAAALSFWEDLVADQQ
jgi:hypothetical protein